MILSVYQIHLLIDVSKSLIKKGGIKMETTIDLSEKEYEELKRLAELSNMEIAEYIKLKLFGSSDNKEKLVAQTLEKIDELSARTKFNIRQLFGTEWNKLARGTRLSLGKRIMSKSQENNAIFKPTEKDSQHTQWYVKI
jgi:hypothetical protein